MFTAWKVSEVYPELGVDTTDLGCLMIKVKNPFHFLGEFKPGDEYFSPDYAYVQGLTRKDWHTTVRHGFLPGVKKRHVDKVLAHFDTPLEITGEGWEVFQPANGEPYECVVLRVAGDGLLDLNRALGVLPNITTFPEYKPHVTYGYFRKGWFEENKGLLDYKLHIPTTTLYYSENLLGD